MVKLKPVCVDGRNLGVGYRRTERVAVLQALRFDFLTSSHSRGISSDPCCC